MLSICSSFQDLIDERSFDLDLSVILRRHCLFFSEKSVHQINSHDQRTETDRFFDRIGLRSSITFYSAGSCVFIVLILFAFCQNHASPVCPSVKANERDEQEIDILTQCHPLMNFDVHVSLTVPQGIGLTCSSSLG